MTKYYFLLIAWFISVTLFAEGGGLGTIEGVVSDKRTGETIIGASIYTEGSTAGTVSDLDGAFRISNLTPGKYKIKTSYISYNTSELDGIEVKSGETTIVNITLESNSSALDEVTVVSVRRMNSEVSIINAVRNSTSVVSGVSSQQITKTQDRDASEVIKRIPGISIIDDKFVITRGLAQRYNNVWINNSAVPSSEADVRSFSFDMIPSSQIENIMIVKSPSPELPGDFSGGFVKIATKSMPAENSLQLSYGINFNTHTQFHDLKYAKGSSTDFLGFDNGFRALNNIIPTRLNNDDPQQVDAATKNGFNNDWYINTKKPIPDQRFSLALNRKFSTESGKQWGLVAALNYSYASRTYLAIENARFGVYDLHNDEPDYLYKYTDNQYTSDAKIGAMLNVSFIPNAKHKYEFRNILNQSGRDRYTEREGYQYVSGYYQQEKTEYIYSSRMSYSGQLAGNHSFSEENKLDWTMGFSYADKNQPDRRIIEREENGYPEDIHFGEMQVDQNDIFRDFIKLNEYIYSLTANYKRDFYLGKLKPTLKTGIYGQYRDREYKNRAFYYRWYADKFPDDFSYRDVVSQLLIPENYGADKLYIYEDTDNRNSYSGSELSGAAYLAFNIPLNKFNIYAGARLEYNKMSLTNYTSIREFREKTTDYDETNVFPSVNATYNLNDKSLLRLAYGASINRQEFREVSASVYYDFDLFSSIKGNPNLKPAHIQNFDFRYEFYPSASELISVALFYKHFKDPIEWTYIDAGGSYTYTFENARSADNFGVEVDIKKNLDFIGMKDFSLSFNGALIDSQVKFDSNSQEHDRAMQGQSPFIVNTGVFYQNDRLALNAGLLYNIIGKRIVGIGRVDTSEGGSIDNDVPDMYEMPRNVLDLTVSKKFGKMFEVNVGFRDMLAQKVVFKQFPQFYDEEGNLQEREQTAKSFKPGRNISLSVKMNF